MTNQWEIFYRSDWMALYSLWVIPALFLLWAPWAGPGRGARSRGGRFVHFWALIFAVETLLDPFATGPMVAGASENVATGVSLLFVLLGDFRVLVLAFYLVATDAGLGRNALRALGFTVAVPVTAWASFNVLEAFLGPLSQQVLWLCHELLFVWLALWLRAECRGDRQLSEMLAYVALYYALWASSDLLILAKVDAGWLLRILPNQLYYAFFVPYVYVTFDWRGAEASEASSSPVDR